MRLGPVPIAAARYQRSSGNWPNTRRTPFAPFAAECREMRVAVVE